MPNKYFEALSILTISASLGALLRQFLYYKAFGIRIYQFLELDEIILHALDGIVYFLIFLSLNYLSYHIYKYQNNLLKEVIIMRTTKFKIIAIQSLRLFVLIILSSILYGIFISTVVKLTFVDAVYWLILFIIAIYINPRIYIRLNSRTISNSRKRNTLAAIAVVEFWIFIAILGINESYKRKHFNPEVTISFVDGHLLTTNDSLYYLGKTKTYLFTYSIKSNSTSVHPINGVDKIQFRK